MNETAEHKTLCWTPDQLPPNVRLGANSVITGNYLPGDHPFKRFRSRLEPAIVIGEGCTLNGLYFNMGEEARIEIGDYCYVTEAFLLCELELRIGNYVVIGWHTTVTDADFSMPLHARRSPRTTLASHSRGSALSLKTTCGLDPTPRSSKGSESAKARSLNQGRSSSAMCRHARACLAIRLK